MKLMPKASSIRTRLLVAFVSIIVVGFAGLTLVAGGQISSAAQADYTQRLQNEISLIAQGVSPLVDDYVDGRTTDRTLLDAALKTYESQANGTLTLFTSDDISAPGSRNSSHEMLELDTAMRGQVILVERANEGGENTFYTAAPVYHNKILHGLLQLSVPTRNLQDMVTQRWLELVLVFATVTGLALIAALWLSRSIIQPLYKLRESALKLSTGDFSHRVAYTRKDEIGEVAQAFNEMAGQVESMLEEQRAFASNTSHELRTPLTTIRLRTEALRYDSGLDQNIAKQYIEEIDDEIIRLGNLVQDLTLLSRFDAGRAELGQDQVDMLRFASSMQHQMSLSARDKNIRITLQLPEVPVPVSASINHLTVVFRNLLDNAIKYTPEGGEITWEVTPTNNGVCNIIWDTGRGVDAVHLPYLFERFYRVDKARSRDIPGTGLGLALVKSIIEAYGGSIHIESEGADKGMTAKVFWPSRPVRKTQVA
ncbi:MAG: HAMP domain-containing sensor histidine kinase [Chloroflexota bacterium]